MNRSTLRTRRALVSVPVALLGVMTLAVNPMSASATPTPTPAITSWKASPTTLNDSGGKVTFTGVFKYAQTCDLSVSPGVPGVKLVPVSCTTNKYSKTLTLPKNTTGAPKDYTFAFYVKNNTGKTSAANIIVAVGAAPPPINFTPTSVSFGSQGVAVGSTPLKIQVTNNSATATQNLTQFSLSGNDTSDFSYSDGNCSVALSPHQSCDMSVTFTPQSGGSRTAVLNVFDNSWGVSGTTAPLHLGGIGEFATASISTTDLVYPPEGVLVATNYEPITVTNSGAVPLVMQGISVVGGNTGDFSYLVNTCFGASGGNIISVGDSCSVLVQFDPLGSGPRQSTLVLQDNTAGSATDITLKGTGAWASSTLNTYALSFGGVSVGSSSTINVTITNTGAVGLRFDINPQYNFLGNNSEDFSYSADTASGACTDAGIVIDPGQFCQFAVTFHPSAAGPRTATFQLYDNSNNASTSTPGYEQITLTGTGD
ncbi:MAG: choice-of-anchor D domain-containing protein [Acidimicrobiales bacterium]